MLYKTTTSSIGSVSNTYILLPSRLATAPDQFDEAKEQRKANHLLPLMLLRLSRLALGEFDFTEHGSDLSRAPNMVSHLDDHYIHEHAARSTQHRNSPGSERTTRSPQAAASTSPA